MRLGTYRPLSVGEHGPGLDREDEQQNDGADHRQGLLMRAGRKMQLVGERRQHQGADRQEEQGCDHPWRLVLESQHAVPGAAHDEGETQYEKRVDEDRADQRGLDYDDETRPEREDGDEELGQIADDRLHDAGCRRPEIDPELIGRLADHIGDAGQCQGADDKTRYCLDTQHVQHRGEHDQDGRCCHGQQGAAFDRCEHLL